MKIIKAMAYNPFTGNDVELKFTVDYCKAMNDFVAYEESDMLGIHMLGRFASASKAMVAIADNANGRGLENVTLVF